MCNYEKKQVSRHHPTQLKNCSVLRPRDNLITNCGQSFKNISSFDDIVYLNDEENIMTFVDTDFGITLYPETHTRIRQINREWKYTSRFPEKTMCIPSSDQHNCFFDKQHTFNIFLKPYNLWEMIPAALMSLNRPNDRDSMSNQYPQPTTDRPKTDLYPVFSSLRTMDTKMKRVARQF